ncbi:MULTISPECIES: hypothetical protein [Pseudomonas]|nr:MULTISPECIES: hypothetical protein [Pseudomonas]EPM91765.1 hypothetical protein A259_38336 [Pseudomonas syringae pv. actinidiae ICMP 19070]AAZ33375.1 conserved hypothetical protein [Pseudomonas savastanoi pv. phaseolicola 1448A]AQL39519.1 hypothetical protein JN853_25870 [Pseudomonas syringae pv. actinidiae ICMP 9853]EGH65557.1 hypothetical protein PSYAC_11726 [Pseudomonas syringae pv. actinidiae str. M302091]EPM44862.1 hypothetical protein A256_25888 [Pseudomonas syringae pv. actinidiae IC
MTEAFDSEPPNNIVDFKPKSQLDPEAHLVAFIEWAKNTLPKGIPNRVNASIRWEDGSWHSHGLLGCSFTALGSTFSARKTMQAPFTEFTKAILVYRRVYLQKKGMSDWMNALRGLEVALFELTGTLDVTRVSAAVCNNACEHMKRHWTKGNTAYLYSKSLEAIIALMLAKKLLKSDFRWTSPLKQSQRGTLKQQREDREKKLPNPEAIRALGEVFTNELTSRLDIVVTSACALLLSAPSRVGELADIPLDFLLFKEDAQGNRRMFLRWYAEKMNQVTAKPVVIPEMEPVVERVITLLKPITDEARAYAAWLEDHPDEFPPHAGVPLKGADEPLTYGEACAALKLAVNKGYARSVFNINLLKSLEKQKALSPAARALLTEIRDGWDSSRGKRIHVKGKIGVQGWEFDDRCVITLRKLNMLLREKYLPKDFPYTTPYTEGKARLKYRDALFTMRTGVLAGDSGTSGAQLGFGVEIAANTGRMNAQLGGTNNPAVKSLFERYGYPGVKVNTHAFRHELNTQMRKAGLSQLLIDAFSGRSSMGSVYNHETVEERTQGVAAYHPKTKLGTAALRLDKVKTNQPLSLADVRELREGEQDRIIHQTHLGVCVHNFASEPCPKMGACLDCGRLGCVKGDDVKLGNLKEERDDLKRRLDKALDAQSRDVFGASEWAKKLGEKLFKCEELIQTLENPGLEKGAIVWNADNGWTLTKNAVAMSGLIAVKVIEEHPAQEALSSLDDVLALLNEIEG